MPLAPAPLLPGTSPIPAPGRRPPDKKALRLGALLAVPTLIITLLAGGFLLPRLLFLAPGFQARAGGGDAGSAGGAFQGFVFTWSRQDTQAYQAQNMQGGYTTQASTENLRFEAKTFHMNSVIIPVYADMPERNNAPLYWKMGDSANLDTLPDADIEKAITDARKAGLTPILELEVRQFDTAGDEGPGYVGSLWAGVPGIGSLGYGDIYNLEHRWFNSYTDFAVHYAQMSAKHKLPYFIIGDGLASMSYDTDQTSAKNDTHGIDIPPDESRTCSGRRDCEWRHVVYAIQHSAFQSLTAKDIGRTNETGGGYSGKLIYTASWAASPSDASSNATTPEFEGISWWNALDYIGVDAGFPLLSKQIVPDVATLERAWQGQGTGLAGQGNIYSRLEKVADKYNKSVVFTSAGYLSLAGSNNPANDLTGAAVSQDEQLNDMQALLMTFKGTPWFAGVFWNGDIPFTPREQQPNWASDSAWAGNTLDTSKEAGKWLASYWQDSPAP